MRRLLLAVWLAAVTLTGCGAAASGPAASVPADAVRLAADRMAFDQAALRVPAGRAFTLAFENREAVPHNVAIRDAAGSAVFEGEVFGGPATKLHQVPALAAGSYSFRCDLHPEMKGALDAR